ncbi:MULTISPECIES: hypothetical protein [Bacillus cereus group]|uniref:hypothetical protein n=1 Tax=Bacillus cereus group TaxID=86661 RepID=UPI00325393D8
MEKVLTFNFPGERHVDPTLALIEELVKRGEEVVYYCVKEYKEKFERTGASFRPYENFLATVNMLERMKGKINSSELLLHMVKSMDNTIKIVIEELAVSFRLFCYSYGSFCIKVNSIFISKFREIS